MATGITIAGRGSLRIDSTIYNCTAIKTTIGSEKRTKVVGMRGVAGDKVECVAPKLTATIIVTSDVSLATLGGYEDVTVEGQMADGRSFVLEGASITDPPEHSAEDGTCDVSFEAMSGSESGV
jgi:hypothetical protein